MGNEISNAPSSPSSPDSDNAVKLTSTNESSNVNDSNSNDNDHKVEEQANPLTITPEILVTPATPTPFDYDTEPERQYSDGESNFDEAELVSFLFSEENNLDNDKDNDKETENEPQTLQWAEEMENDERNLKEIGINATLETSENFSADKDNLNRDERGGGGGSGIERISEDYGRPTGGLRMYSPRDVRLGKLVGEGGFGRVLRGFLHGTPVAIKLFHAPIDAKRIPMREMDALMSLKHRCVVSIFGVVKQTETLDCPQLIVQNFSEGNVLQFLSWKDNPEDNGTLGKFAFDILEGCQYLRSKGIIHGNLAARNILVEKLIARNRIYYNAKVSDMGIIRFAEPSGGNYMKVTGSERIVPIRWVPKEIIEENKDGTVGSDFSFESDVWSFGVVLWELWTRGATPYGSSYSNLRVMQFIKDGYSPLKVHRPTECPPQVVAVMENIFKTDPYDRPTFSALHGAFRTFKGYGKEVKPLPKSNPKKGNGPKHITEYNDNGMPISDVMRSPSPYSTEPKEKGEKKKKKKPVGKNKAKLNPIPGREFNSSLDNPPYNGMGPGTMAYPPQEMVQVERNDQDRIAALLRRVNQLESDRMLRDEGRGRGGRGRGRGILSQEHWKRRLGPGPPRFNRIHTEYNDGANMMPSPPSSPPTPTALPPPPYTEDPLPNHSSTAFPTPRDVVAGPSHEYQYRPPSRGRGSGAASNRPLGREQEGNQGEDFIRKIRRLAEEIEVLRAEKMTQELLKKSAELADLMKYMSLGRGTTSMPREDTRNLYDPVEVPHRSRDSREHRDFNEGYTSSYAGAYPGSARSGPSGRWQDQGQSEGGRDYYSYQHHPRGASSHHNHRGTPPYYKGRGGRGYDKYGGDGSGSYGGYYQGPYGGQL